MKKLRIRDGDIVSTDAGKIFAQEVRVQRELSKILSLGNRTLRDQDAIRADIELASVPLGRAQQFGREDKPQAIEFERMVGREIT